MTLYPPGDLPLYMTLAHDIECGLLHSGLPSCCVAYFVSEWVSMTAVERIRHPDHSRKRPVGYVRCPGCVASKTIVPVKPCACPEQINVGERIQFRKDSGEWEPIPGTNGKRSTTRPTEAPVTGDNGQDHAPEPAGRSGPDNAALTPDARPPFRERAEGG